MPKQRIYNSKLNPDLWDVSDNLLPDVSTKLLKIATDFYTDIEIKAALKDVLFLGSSANYNWTPTSDIDLHLVIDINELGMPDELTAKSYLDALKSKWNYDHDITIKSHNVETYIQGVNHVTHATGIYSLMKGIWLSKPVKENVTLDRELIRSKYQDYVFKIQKVTSEPTAEKLKALLDDIYKMRQSGLDTKGELSTENLVFKLIRNKGYLDKLRELKIKIYDKSVSLAEKQTIKTV
jgi:hypothetical protein